MNLRQLIKPDAAWLDAPTPRRVAAVALTACAGLAVYGFTVGCWRDPVTGAYVAVKLPRLIALTLGCNGLLNGLLGLLLGSGLGFRQSLLALQMTTSLRPILRRSNLLLTQEKKFFLQHWFETLDQSLKPQLAAKAPETRGETRSSSGGRNPFHEN